MTGQRELELTNDHRCKEVMNRSTVVLNSLNISEDVAEMNVAWSNPETQIESFWVPRYFIGVNAERLGSNDPISSVRHCVQL